MIAKSDLVILAISATLLVAGIYRWQSNVSQFSGRSTPAESSRSNQPRASGPGSLTGRPAGNRSTTTSAANNEAPVRNNLGGADQPATRADAAQNASTTAEGSATLPIKTASGTASGSSAAKDAPLYGNYKVQPGDTLSKISLLHGTTVDTLRSINNISGSLINIDQNIRYPLPAN